MGVKFSPPLARTPMTMLIKAGTLTTTLFRHSLVTSCSWSVVKEPLESTCSTYHLYTFFIDINSLEQCLENFDEKVCKTTDGFHGERVTHFIQDFRYLLHQVSLCNLLLVCQLKKTTCPLIVIIFQLNQPLSEWAVSLMSLQHNIGYLVPYNKRRNKSKKNSQ